MELYAIPRRDGWRSGAELNLAPGCSTHVSDGARRVSRRWSALIVLVILCGATAIPVAPAQASGRYPYTLVIPGTFGGPSSYLDEPGIPLTSDGALIGAADTATRNKAYQACPSHLCADSYEQRAFAWRNGKLTDLGVPPGWSGSMVNQLNRFGVGAGSLERGFNRWMPPDNRLGHAAGVAALFKQGRVVELGTLPGGSLSFAQNIDSRGQVAGNSNNGTKDPFRPGATETRVFVWNHGAMKDIGTLGGPDTFISWQNGDGQIVGSSYTSYTPDPANYGAGALGGSQMATRQDDQPRQPRRNRYQRELDQRPRRDCRSEQPRGRQDDPSVPVGQRPDDQSREPRR